MVGTCRERMPTYRIPKAVLVREVGGKKRVARPKARCKNEVEKDNRTIANKKKEEGKKFWSKQFTMPWACYAELYIPFNCQTSHAPVVPDITATYKFMTSCTHAIFVTFLRVT